jgi:hypothetical protein
MGVCPPKQTLERVDNNGNYEPDNCKWATRREQARNRKSSIFLTVKGTKVLQADLAKSLNLNDSVVSYYRRKGWSGDEIVRKYYDTEGAGVRVGA